MITLGDEAGAAETRVSGADPRALGCECDTCPLKGRQPVFGEFRPEARLLIVGEAPGANEVESGRPFVGASGREVERALESMGLRRADVSLTNAMLCRPPGDLRRYLKQNGKKNAARRKARLPVIRSPIECCAPRLRKEIAAAPAVLLFGATALGAALGGGTGSEAGLTRRRGYPFDLDVEGRRVPALATYHPAFVLRKRRFTETFRSDVAKAFRHAAGRLQWVDPGMVIDPSIGELDGALAALGGKVVAIDTETDGLDVERVNLRCVGVGSADFVLVAGFRSVETPGRIWRCPPDRARERLANFFLHHPKLCGQNLLPYDARVLERHGMPLPGWWGVGGKVPIDNLLAHHLTDSELPHGLEYQASRFTDCPRWKPEDQDAWTSDMELHGYCASDVAITARLAPGLIADVNATGQVGAYRSDEELARLCVGMRRAGLLIDQAERARHGARLAAEMRDAEARAWAALEAASPGTMARLALDALAGARPKISSPDQLRQFLYSDLKLKPTDFETPGGDASTSKDAIYELLERHLDPAVEGFLAALLDYRRAEKMKGSFVDNLEVGPDGRVHPTWNPAGTIVGRVSCSGPNVTTIPATKLDSDSLRSMFIAAPGNVLVYADSAQIHLRLIALLAGDEELLGAFDRGLDVHKVNARDVFGLKSLDEVTDALRGGAKPYVYAMAYRAGAETIWKTLKRVITIDKAGVRDRPYARRSLAETDAVRRTYLRRHPGWERWWDRSVAEYRGGGVKRTLRLGRLRRFLDGGGDEEAVSEIINYDVLGLEGDLMGGSGAAGRLMASVGWPFDGGTSRGGGMGGPGILSHTYDALMCEVSELRGLEAAAALEAAMQDRVEYGGRSVRITSAAKIGKRWSDFG